MTATKTEYEAAFDHGVASTPLQDVGNTTFAILPDGYTVEDIQSEKFQPAPSRIRAKVTLADVASFTSYVNEFKVETDTKIFARREDSSLAAILDYHGDKPSWCTHTSHLQLKSSPEWALWKPLHKANIAQHAFAEFLEDRFVDIIEPDGATILETAMNLEARKTVVFKSGKNLSNGSTQLEYIEEIEGKGSAGGQLIIPSKFTIRVPIYYNGAPVDIPARLRYRISDTKLSFTVIFERLETIVDQAFADVLSVIAEATAIHPLLGSYAPG